MDSFKGNNFNLIRIYLSLSVFFFHSYELSHESGLMFLNRFFNGERAVQAFFIISGYLIIMSYHRSNSAKDFLLKRIRRVYPAYFVIILSCAILGCLISTLSATQYFTSIDFYKYIAANLCFLNFIQPSLPGVFNENIYTTINGSLWSLKIEVAYYLLAPLLIFLRGKINVHILYSIVFLSSVGYFIGMKYLYSIDHNEAYFFLSHQIPGQLFYFILGAWVVELEKKKWFIPVVKWLGIPSLLALFFPVSAALQSILIAIVVFFCAYIVPMIKYPYREQDISYGIYIYHFPIIQVLVYYQLYRPYPVMGLICSLIILLIISTLSWLFIEKPFIARKLNQKLAKQIQY